MAVGSPQPCAVEGATAGIERNADSLWEWQTRKAIRSLLSMCYTDSASGRMDAGVAGKDLLQDSGLARDCGPPYPTAYFPAYLRKPRWLLWLDGPSTDRPRRAAATLRYLDGSADELNPMARVRASAFICRFFQPPPKERF